MAYTKQESEIAAMLRAKIRRHSEGNQKRLSLFEGRFVADQIGIAVPPGLRDWPVRIGWGGTIVRTNSARSSFLGYQAPDADLMGLDRVVARNRLATMSDRVMETTLVCGTSFVVSGHAGGGDALVRHVPPTRMAVMEDPLTERVTSALYHVNDDRGGLAAEILYVPGQRIVMRRDGYEMVEVERSRTVGEHVPVTQFKHQPNDNHPDGRSVLTPPIEYSISAAARTMLGMEVHREFFSAPMRAAMGAEPEQFGFDEDMSPEERANLGWSLVMGRMNIVPAGEQGIPQMHEFKPSPPTSYIEILRYLSLMTASDAGLPASYFGVLTDNPSSSDAIKALESQVSSRAEERMREFDWYWLDVARNALLMRDGSVDEDALSAVEPEWEPAATATPAAQADSAMKLVAADILPKHSKVTWDRVGLSKTEQIQAQIDLRAQRAQEILDQIAYGGGPRADNEPGDGGRLHNLASQRLAPEDRETE